MSDAASPPIQTRGLSKTYRLGFFMNKRVRALQGLDLTVQAGEVFGILGPNGAGKSTTLKILMNLVRATSGEAKLFGRPPEDRAARAWVGFLPENPSPYEYLTGREFVTLAGHLTALPRRELSQRVAEVLDAVGMTRSADLQIRRYSKGMVQRVALAQALVNRPKLLILDEPTSGLDPVGRRQIRDIVLREKERGTTVVFCTHIIPDVEALCDRVAVLVNGRLVREGGVRELLATELPSVELLVENVSLETVRGWNIPFEQAQSVGGRLLLRARDSEAQLLVARLLAGGGRLASMSPAHASLEDLFLSALSQAGQGSVGGEIS